MDYNERNAILTISFKQNIINMKLNSRVSVKEMGWLCFNPEEPNNNS